MNPRAVLWDMDGTLIDSAEAHFEAWHEILAPCGYDLTPENFNKFFGRRNDAILHGYLGDDLPDDRMEELSLEKENIYRRIVRRDGARFLPGVLDWLAHLKQQGWRQAVATSAPRLNVDVVLEGSPLGDIFSAVVSAEDVKISKPNPEVFLTAAQKLGVPPDRCIVVEDAPAGIEAARRAGMPSVGICIMHPELPADVRVKSLEEIGYDVFERLIANGL